MSEAAANLRSPEENSWDLDALHAEHSGRVAWVVAQVLGEDGEREDCIQEVWIRVQQGLPGLRDPDRVGPWIGSIARNTALESLRGGRRQARALRAALEVARYEELLRAQSQGELEASPLLDAVATLEPDQRRLVELRLEDERLTLQDLASRMDTPHHKVKYLWSRAKAVLRARLREWESVGALLGVEG